MPPIGNLKGVLDAVVHLGLVPSVSHVDLGSLKTFVLMKKNYPKQ